MSILRKYILDNKVHKLMIKHNFKILTSNNKHILDRTSRCIQKSNTENKSCLMKRDADWETRYHQVADNLIIIQAWIWPFLILTKIPQKYLVIKTKCIRDTLVCYFEATLLFSIFVNWSHKILLSFLMSLLMTNRFHFRPSITGVFPFSGMSYAFSAET